MAIKRKAAKKAAKRRGKTAKRSATRAAAKAPAAPKRRSARAAMAVATSAKKSVQQRVAAFDEVPLAVCDTDDNLQKTLGILRDTGEPIEVRLAALQSLQAASFSVIAFEGCRGDYVAALRTVATDPNPELRQRALGILARQKDGFAQKKLLEGLRQPEKALVPPEKALQLLSYDIHGGAYAAARQIAKEPPNPAAKHQALRLLAADAASAPMFEKILLDKDEQRDNRQVAAAALHALRPDKLQERAREIVLDTGDYPEIQATSLTALTQFGDEEALAGDQSLLARVEGMKAAAPAKVKQSARQFLKRYVR
jgi:hypothetical protein